MSEQSYCHFRAYLTKAAYSKAWAQDSTSQSRARSACILTGKVTFTLTKDKGKHIRTAFSVIYVLIRPCLLQFHNKPLQQQDAEHRPALEPPHEVGCVHQELLPERVLGSGGARAVLLPLLVRGVLWGREQLRLLHFTSHFSCTQCYNILGIKYHTLWWCVTVCWLDYDSVGFYAVVHSLFRFWSCVSPISSRWQWTAHTCLSSGIGCRTWAASTSWRSWETWSSPMLNCGESAKKPESQTLLCSGYQC